MNHTRSISIFIVALASHCAVVSSCAMQQQEQKINSELEIPLLEMQFAPAPENQLVLQGDLPLTQNVMRYLRLQCSTAVQRVRHFLYNPQTHGRAVNIVSGGLSSGAIVAMALTNADGLIPKLAMILSLFGGPFIAYETRKWLYISLINAIKRETSKKFAISPKQASLM